jgi:hypothetical protein
MLAEEFLNGSENQLYYPIQVLFQKYEERKASSVKFQYPFNYN